MTLNTKILLNHSKICGIYLKHYTLITILNEWKNYSLHVSNKFLNYLENNAEYISIQSIFIIQCTLVMKIYIKQLIQNKITLSVVYINKKNNN